MYVNKPRVSSDKAGRKKGNVRLCRTPPLVSLASLSVFPLRLKPRKKGKPMHEYPVTESIIKIAEKRGREARASRIERITLVVGDRSGFIGDSVRMYFDLIAEGTLCEGAELIVKPVRSQLSCPVCGALFYRKPMSFVCPVCGADGAPTEIGKEFYIESIEIS
jgi:hydrogenase nickel incorporation protein HypA/HybF